MVLNVEIGSPDSEAYISVSDADDYVGKWHGDVTAWDSASDAAKEVALRLGARFVDSHKFKGYRTNEDQALAWPRIELGWIDGQWIDSDEIPKRIESANIEAALKDAEGEDLFPTHDGGTIKSESSAVGPLNESVTYQTSKKPAKVFEVVRSLLEPLLIRGTRLLRGIG